MDKRERTRMCSSKTRYKTRNRAKKVKSNIRNWDGTIMRIYECDYCSGFHLSFDKENNDGEKKEFKRRGPKSTRS